MKYIKTLLFCLLIVFSLSSCEQIKNSSFGRSFLGTPKYETKAFQDSVVVASLKNNTFLDKLNSRFIDTIKIELTELYDTTKNSFIWQNVLQKTENPALSQLISEIEKAPNHALKSTYNIDKVKALKEELYRPIPDGQEPPFSEEELIIKKANLEIMASSAAMAFLSDFSMGLLKNKRWTVNNNLPDLSDLLENASKKGDFSTALTMAGTNFRGYEVLKKELAKYKNIVKNGGLPKITVSISSQNLKNLVDYLTQTGDLKTTTEPKLSGTLLEALKKYQTRNGLVASGKLDKKTVDRLAWTADDLVDKIELNMERYRWLPSDMGDNYVIVNVPEYWCRVYENDKEVFDFNVVVGENTTPTPVFADPMKYIVLSPVWNVPTSIARDEILKWVHMNPMLLVMNDIECYYKGKKLTRDEVMKTDWKAAEKDWRNWRFKQPPSEENSLGEVKFIFPNKHAVYLHDTPEKSYFKYHDRALSSGCVRVSKPVDFAKYLLRDVDGGKWNEHRIEANMGRKSERRVNLKSHPMVYMYYLTAWGDNDGNLQIRNDIYRHDRRQLKQWKGI